MGTRTSVISICKGPASTQARLPGAPARVLPPPPPPAQPAAARPASPPASSPPPPPGLPRDCPGRAGSQATRFLAATSCTRPAGRRPPWPRDPKGQPQPVRPGRAGPRRRRGGQGKASVHPRAAGWRSRTWEPRLPSPGAQAPGAAASTMAAGALRARRRRRRRRQDGRAQRARLPAPPRPPGAPDAGSEGPGPRGWAEPGRRRPGRGSSSSARASGAAEGGAPSASRAFAGPVPPHHVRPDCAPGPGCAHRRSLEEPGSGVNAA